MTINLASAPWRAILPLIAGGVLIVAGARSIRADNVCVAMPSSGGIVAGLQLDLSWDANCMKANPGSGNQGQCQVNSSTGKTVSTAIQGGSRLRAIMYSTSDSSPMPDGDLFCCAFTASPSAPAGGPCCGLSMGNVILADPTGTRVSLSAAPLVVTLGQNTCAVSGGGGEGTAPVRPQLPSAPLPGAVAVPPVVVGGAPPAAPAGQAPAAQQPAGQQPARQAPAGQAPGAAAGTGAALPGVGVPPAQQPDGAGQVAPVEAGTPAAVVIVTRVAELRQHTTPGATLTPHLPTPAPTAPAATPSPHAAATHTPAHAKPKKAE
jgi:hypothetical protein